MTDRISTDELRGLLATTSPGPWSVEIDGPTWGWVEVKGPSFKVSGPTMATDLSHADEVRRKTDARLIALAPELAAEVIRLREALEPFAKVAEHDIGYDEADTDVFRPMKLFNRAPRIRVGDIRRALAALNHKETDNGTA